MRQLLSKFRLCANLKASCSSCGLPGRCPSQAKPASHELSHRGVAPAALHRQANRGRSRRVAGDHQRILCRLGLNRIGDLEPAGASAPLRARKAGRDNPHRKLPQSSASLLCNPWHHRRAGDDRQWLLLQILCLSALASIKSGPSHIRPRLTARPSASSRPAFANRPMPSLSALPPAARSARRLTPSLQLASPALWHWC